MQKFLKSLQDVRTHTHVHTHTHTEADTHTHTHTYSGKGGAKTGKQYFQREKLNTQ